jgi:hypothetical protein
VVLRLMVLVFAEKPCGKSEDVIDDDDDEDDVVDGSVDEEGVGIGWDGRGKCDLWVVVVDGESAEEKDVQKDSILTETEPDDDDAGDGEDEEDDIDDADVVAETATVADDDDVVAETAAVANDCSVDATCRRTEVIIALVDASAASYLSLFERRSSCCGVMSQPVPSVLYSSLSCAW